MRPGITLRKRYITFGTMALTVSLATCLASSAADESPETREVKEKLAAQAAKIQSIEVKYRLETRTDLKPDQLRALPGFHNQVFLPQEEWTEAYKGEKRYRRQIQPEHVTYLAPVDAYGLVSPEAPDPKAPPEVQASQKKMQEQYDRAVAVMKAQEARGIKIPKRDPSVRPISERDVIRGFNGHSLWMRHPFTDKSDEVQVFAPRSKMQWFQLSAYLGSVGLHQPDPTMAKEPAGPAMFQVATWVRNPSYKVLDKTEVIDGATCLVLKGGLDNLPQLAALTGELVDTIWLDRDHGLAVSKREMTRAGQPFMRWTNSDLREVTPGLWLPRHCRQDTFSPETPAEFKDKPVITVEIKVEKIEVNNVPDSRFDLETKPGDRVEDMRASF